jgi:hypothetical protein
MHKEYLFLLKKRFIHVTASSSTFTAPLLSWDEMLKETREQLYKCLPIFL